MAELPILIILNATGQLPQPTDKKRKQAPSTTPIEQIDKVVNGALDRFFKSIDGDNPNYNAVFSQTPGTQPNYGSIFNGKGTAPNYGNVFPDKKAIPPNYDSIFGSEKATPKYDSVFGSEKATPKYDSVFGSEKATPNYDSVFGSEKATPKYDSVFGSEKATPNYDSLFGSPGAKPDYSKVFGSSKPENMEERYSRLSAPSPSVTTNAAWARIDDFEFIPNPDIPGTYKSKNDNIKGLFAIDHETGNLYYLPNTEAKDDAGTPDWDESKPAATQYGEKFAWVNKEVPRRVLGAAKLNLMRGLTGHYLNRDKSDPTAWYLQSDGTYWTPNRIDPETKTELGATTFDGTNFLSDDKHKNPLVGTVDAVTLNLFRTGENKYRQQGIPGHFELGTDGLFHYKDTSGIPHNSKIQGLQYYDSSNPKIEEQKWVKEK